MDRGNGNARTASARSALALAGLRGALPFIVPLAVIVYALFVLQLAPERAAVRTVIDSP